MKMVFDSDSSENGGQTSCFCDSPAKEGSVEGVPLKQEKEIIQLASVRNKAICFREQSNYNRRQRKLANFLTIEKSDNEGPERKTGEWIMCWNKSSDEESVKTTSYPWTARGKHKFELVPWRKQKKQLDIINYTAWEPDELTSSKDGGRARKFKQHPPPASHNQEIRRLIRSRFLFSFELQRQRQLKILSRLHETDHVIETRKFEKILGQSRGDNPDESQSLSNGKVHKLASNFVGYFGSEFVTDSEESVVSSGGGSEEQNRVESEQVQQSKSSNPLSEINYSDWLACSDSFKCSECQRYFNNEDPLFLLRRISIGI